MDKPLGLKIITWFFIIYGVLGLVVKLPFLTFTPITPLMIWHTLYFALLIAFGIGLLNVKRWAWFGAVIIIAASTVGVFIDLIWFINKDVSPGSILTFIELIINGAIIVYLLRTDIKKVFQVSV